MKGPIGRIFVTSNCSINSIVEKLGWNLHVLVISILKGIRDEFHDHVGGRIGSIGKTKGNAPTQLVSIMFVILHPRSSRYRRTGFARLWSSRFLRLVFLRVKDLLLRYKLFVDCNASASPQC